MSKVPLGQEVKSSDSPPVYPGDPSRVRNTTLVGGVLNDSRQEMACIIYPLRKPVPPSPRVYREKERWGREVGEGSTEKRRVVSRTREKGEEIGSSREEANPRTLPSGEEVARVLKRAEEREGVVTGDR